jgi:uncharacterized protein YgbK (DUF1537 family)
MRDACLFAAIADDYTGGADLAGMLFEQGVRTVQVFGLQSEAFFREIKGRFQAVVLSLKSRSIPAADACRLSIQAYERLRILEPGQVQFKYCSTFDSTREGNIGPVAEALMERMDAGFTVAVPALPVNGRTQYLGHLFVGGRLLAETHMRHHPVNPMTDSNLVRHLQAQMRRKAGLISLASVQCGPESIRRRIASLRQEGVAVALVDCISDADLEAIARAVADLPLVTGGSGLAMKLPALWGVEAASAPPLAASSGSVLVLAGSCSAATLEQLEAARAAGIPMFRLDDAAIDRALESAGAAIVYSSAPESERDPGMAAAIERAFGEIARRMVRERGVGRLVVAGGETSGAVVNALGIPAVEITAILDPGVPALASLGQPPLALVLKSGNFGTPDFFAKAIRYLRQA